MNYLDLGTVVPNFVEFIPFPVLPNPGKGIFILRFFANEPNSKNEYLIIRAKILEHSNPVSGAIIFPVSDDLIFEFDLIQKINELPYCIECLKRQSKFNTSWAVNLLQVI